MFNDCTQISGKRYIEIAHFVWVLHNILKHTIFAGFVPGGLRHFVCFDPYQIHLQSGAHMVFRSS